MRKLLLTTILATSFIGANSVRGEFVKAIEKWTLPADEELTISKLGVTFDITNNIFAGINMYGATGGIRGGFFTFGFEGGLQTDPTKLLQLRSGLFVGAGGGGAAPQGGGLMLREFIEARVNTKYLSLGGGLSHVDFPNGDIKSTQAFASLYIPFNLQKSDNNYYLNDFLLKNKIYIKGGKYITSSDSKTTSNKPLDDLTLIGIEAQGFITDKIFTTFSLNGANGENADGYMEVFGGFGLEQQIFTLPIYASVIAELGMGGGGKVDTGGGSMYRARASLEANLFQNLLIGVEGGYVKSFEGSFKAKYIGAYFGFKSTFGDKNGAKENYDIRALTKVHLTSKGDFKDLTRDQKIYLEGLAIDKYITKNIYLTGQSLWAFKGKSGGYTEGLLGMGYIANITNNLNIRSEALIGAAGGGGVHTGGLVGVVNASIDYKVDKNLYISVGGGYTKAREGLSTTDISFGIGYKFGIYSK